MLLYYIMKKSLLSKVDLKNKCDTFITNIKYYIDQYRIENIYNSDQSGFQIEFHFDRTLSHKDIKKVKTTLTGIIYINNHA